ncbi:MAG: hypothetical protein EOP49_25495, partial [Sphingobacteriales bacterium]
MKKIIGCIILAVASLAATAQTKWNEQRWQNIIEKEMPANVRMSAALYQLATLAMAEKTEAYSRLSQSGLRHKDGLVNMEVVYRNDANIEKITDEIDAKYLGARGFMAEQVWKNRASIWMKLEDIIPKSKLLSSDYFIFLVTVQRRDDEGPAVMNSVTYKTGAAPGGAGKRVAIFDGGFYNLSGAISAGKAKTPAYVGLGGTASNLTGVNFLNNEHGTACVEMVYDHCPDAAFEVYANGNTTEKGAAVADCIAHGVDVISMSQSEYNLGWLDNTGAACSYAQDAADAGILFLTSCGNRANSHYEAVFTDDDGDGRHEFGPVDETNNLLSNVANSRTTHCYLSWNNSAGTNFDLYIVRTSDNAILASSTNTGTGVAGYEYAEWTNNGASIGVYFRIVRISGPATTFEMFTHSAGEYQHATAAGSNTSPSNTTDLNVISVGAVSHTDWGQLSGVTGIIVDYSSQGPTNSGNIAPKI